ncbi:MAG: DUF4230 domain-containing protein [Lachnospiraceae bacterium]|nr:DUF4230 domain-containing protein [Lachnospiraceae bacterium]
MGREEQERLEAADNQEKQKNKKNNEVFAKYFSNSITKIIIAIIVIAVLAVVLLNVFKKEEPVKEVITVSTLEKIVEVSDLSTFRVVYNGVACADDKYYVSYEATVDAGIDFEAIEITVDNEAKKVTVDLPEAEILDVYVDIASLDYIFIDKKANTETVSEEAYKLCKYDVKVESENQEAIIDLAQQNAENIVTALVQPFVDQVDPEYEIVIE